MIGGRKYCQLKVDSGLIAGPLYTRSQVRPYCPYHTVILKTMSTLSKQFPIVYFNPEEKKDYILKENKEKAGIYRWVHLESGKSYIGSSIRLDNRFKQYFRYSHLTSIYRNMRINKALLKYGYSGFRFEILEYCSVKELLTREQFYLDQYQPEYNILKVAGSTLGYRHSKDSKTLIGLASKNRKRSEVTRELISKALLGLKSTKEHVEKMSKSNTFRQPIILTNTETAETKEFSSMTDASNYLETSRVQIRNYLIKNIPFKGYLISKPFSLDTDINNIEPFSRVQQQPLLITHTETGETIEFISITEAANYLKISRGQLWYHFNKKLNTGGENLIKGYRITKVDIKHGEVSVKRATKCLEITDIMTKEKNTYSSFTLAGKALGVQTGSISNYLRKKSKNKFKNRFIIKLI